jgi:surface polysaccharide O-acyltransferase-like enzyme
MVFHSSREVFFVLTALVLVHGYGRRSVRWGDFWRKRYLCVAVPYLAWTVIYMCADGHWRDPIGTLPHLLVGDLLTGGAKYQLYFLLVSMQIYLVFPLIRWVLQVTRRHHGLLLAGCAVFQLAISLAVQRQWSPDALMTAWVNGPNAVLPSYVFYIMAGAVAGWHLDAVTAWTRAHRRLVLGGTAALVASAVGVYLLQRLAGGESTAAASAVFQPAVVFESVAIAWSFYTAGLIWVDRGMPQHRLVRAGSDSSFGIYLAHPLILMGADILAVRSGLFAASARAPLALVLVLVVTVAVPLVYAISALPTLVLRSTPFSLMMSGRPQRRTSTTPTAAAPARVVAA